MSSQRGNHKKGPQKFQNKVAFKNNLHDTSKRTKEINELDLEGLCERCKEIIDWKIKYKKYKPLTVPKKCTKCQQKTVKKAYYIVCLPCIGKHGVCGKCGAERDLVSQPGLSSAEQMSIDSQFEQELKMLPERKRRTFLRLQAQGKITGSELAESSESLEENTIDDSDKDSFDSDCDNVAVDKDHVKFKETSSAGDAD